MDEGARRRSRGVHEDPNTARREIFDDLATRSGTSGPLHRFGPSGVFGRMSPPVRLGSGILAVLACAFAPRSLAVGVPFQVALAVSLILATDVSSRLITRALYLGALLYIPLALILLLPQLFAPDGGAVGLHSESTVTAALEPALITAAMITLKGGVTLLVAFATLSTLHHTEMHTAVAGLPLPRMVRLLLLQILHQSGLLLDETARVRRALAVRAPGRFGLASTRLIRALPRVWLERIAARAERTALAFELRGYHLHGASPLPPSLTTGWPDILALAAAGVALITALALHIVV